ncbi:phage virion morphogenesis protein [Vibrio mediterranei]
MAGATFHIEVEGEHAIQTQLNTLLNKGQDMQDVLADIGEMLLISHHERFERGVSPDGIPWAPLNPDYAATKKRHQTDILRLNDILSGTLTYYATPLSLLFGTPVEYGAIHQFGGTPDMRPSNAAIAVREWLGLSVDDSSDILARLSDYLIETTP